MTDTATTTSTRDTAARAIFANIDLQDVDAFVAALSEDVAFTFGNNPTAIGRDAVRGAINGFNTMIGGIHHHIQETWDIGDVTVLFINVEYTRLDGEHVTVPNVDILRWRDGEVYDWRIAIDLAPVFA